MEKEIGLFDAKNKLSALVNSVREEGKEYVILHRGKPAAKLIPINPVHDTIRAKQSVAEMRCIRKAAKEEGAQGIALKELLMFRDEGKDKWITQFFNPDWK